MTDPQMPLVLPSPILRSRRVTIKRSRHVLPRVVWSHLMLGVQTWWARQDSNLRPLGCKPADHRPNPHLPATSVHRPPSQVRVIPTHNRHFVSRVVSREIHLNARAAP
jgi:hypothetical protein